MCEILVCEPLRVLKAQSQGQANYIPQHTPKKDIWMALSHNEGVQGSINSAPLVLDHLGYELELPYATGHELTTLPLPGAHRPSSEIHGGPWDQGLRTLTWSPQTRLIVKGHSWHGILLEPGRQSNKLYVGYGSQRRVGMWAATTQILFSPGDKLEK